MSNSETLVRAATRMARVVGRNTSVLGAENTDVLFAEILDLYALADAIEEEDQARRPLTRHPYSRRWRGRVIRRLSRLLRGK